MLKNALHFYLINPRPSSNNIFLPLSHVKAFCEFEDNKYPQLPNSFECNTNLTTLNILHGCPICLSGIYSNYLHIK